MGRNTVAPVFLTSNSTIFNNGTQVGGNNVSFTYAALKTKTSPSLTMTLGPSEANLNLTWIQSTFVGVQVVNATTGHYSHVFFGFANSGTGTPTSVTFDASGSNTSVASGSYCSSSVGACFNSVPAVYYNNVSNYLETNESQATAHGLSVFFFFTITTIAFTMKLATTHGATNATFSVSGTTSGISIVSNNVANTSFRANSGATITVTVPTDGTFTRYRGNTSWISSGTSEQFTVANKTFQLQAYYQLQNTYIVNGNPNSQPFDQGTSITPTGTYAGLAGSNICTISPYPSASGRCAAWADYNKNVTLPIQATGTMLYNPWNATGLRSFQDTTGNNAHTVNYYSLFQMQFAYSIIGSSSGATAPTLNFTQFGSLKQYVETTGLATKYLDEGISWNTTNPLVGSSSTKRWDANAGTSGAPVLNGNQTTKYYAQWNFSIKYTVSAGSPSAPSLTATQFGAAYVPTLTTSSATYWLDNNTAWTFPNPISATSSQRWFSYNSTTGTALLQKTINEYYYEQWFLTVNINPLGGGTSSVNSQFENNSKTFTITATPTGTNTFLNFTGTGSGSYSGTNNPSGTITMNAAITETIFFNGPGGTATVNIFLTQGNLHQPPLGTSGLHPNDFKINWTVSGSGFSGAISANVSTIIADIGSQIQINAVTQASNSSFRTCISNCNNVFYKVPAGVSSLSFFYYGQVNLSVRYVQPTGSPYAAGQIPNFIYTNFGTSSTNKALATSYQTIWTDNGTTWTSTNPFAFDLAYWTPLPTSALANRSALITITYNNGGPPVTNNPQTGFLQGQYVLGFFLAYGQNIGVGVFIAILILAFDAFIYLKSGNAGLTLGILFIGFALFSGAAIGAGGTAASLLGQWAWQIALIFAILFFTGSIYKLITGRQG